MTREEKLAEINVITGRWPLEQGMEFGSNNDVCWWQFSSRATAEGWARQMTLFLVSRGLLVRTGVSPFRYEGKDGERLVLPLDEIV
jgi:hypothetical protein